MLLLAGCDGPQSALSPAGREAEDVGRLFWWMVAGAVVVWSLVFGTAVAATLGWFRNPTSRSANLLILGGGVALPTIVLAVLLTIGLRLLPGWGEDADRLKIHVNGEQWWWRVAYHRPGADEPIMDANEIHLPAGRPVEFVLTSSDVIHSFWIPSIGGKMDMIPGRTTRLLLEATKPGVYRAPCAEFCGLSHAQMAFATVVHAPDEFEAWLDDRAGGAASADGAGRGAAAARGAELFVSSGCDGCHTIEGVAERGTVGPDLTHFGSRRTLGAGIAANTADNVERWIAAPETMKPGVQMPAYGMLPEEEIAAIARFLLELK